MCSSFLIGYKILDYLRQNEFITTAIASELLKLSLQRTRAILSKMAKEDIIVAEGANRNRKYRLKNKEKSKEYKK